MVGGSLVFVGLVVGDTVLSWGLLDCGALFDFELDGANIFS